MMRCLGLFFLTIGCFCHAFAIDGVVSHAVFYQPAAGAKGGWQPKVDVYWQINPQSVHYTTTPEKTIIARIKTDVYFSNDSGGQKEDHFILKTVPRANVEDLMAHNILDLRSYELKPGFVRMKMVLTDLADTTHPFTITDTFTVSPSSAGPFYSGLQLLDTILESAGNTHFNKNGRQQLPACTNFVDDYKYQLHYYAEVYNTDRTDTSDFPLLERVFISKSENDDQIGNFFRKDSVYARRRSLVSGTFNIGSLPSGNYLLQVTLESRQHIPLASQSLFFQRLNKHPETLREDTTMKTEASDTGIEKVTVLNLKKTFVAKYSLGEIRAILKMLLPFSDPQGTLAIRNFLKKPDEIYMRYYVYNYFANINKSDPGSAFKEFSTKIIEVNKLFNTHSTLGYETERGFIYLRYGRPTDRITVESENGSQPYEIWQYNTLTQMNRKEITDAVFLFYRPSQASFDFQLLHCTVEGEAQNIDWRSYLYINGGGNSNSRAEQYLGSR